jgi:hypothetical protein
MDGVDERLKDNDKEVKGVKVEVWVEIAHTVEVGVGHSEGGVVEDRVTGGDTLVDAVLPTEKEKEELNEVLGVVERLVVGEFVKEKDREGLCVGTPETVMGVRLAIWEREGDKDGVALEEGKPEQEGGLVLLSVVVCKGVQVGDKVVKGEKEIVIEEKEDWEELGVKPVEDEVEGESVAPEGELERDERPEAEASNEGALCGVTEVENEARELECPEGDKRLEMEESTEGALCGVTEAEYEGPELGNPEEVKRLEMEESTEGALC